MACLVSVQAGWSPLPGASLCQWQLRTSCPWAFPGAACAAQGPCLLIMALGNGWFLVFRLLLYLPWDWVRGGGCATDPDRARFVYHVVSNLVYL